MSRRLMLYFSCILLMLMLNPMHATRSGASLRVDGRIKWCKPLRWREPPGPVVALASYPGSGNTWLRYLLQQATGEHNKLLCIITGSMYCEVAFLQEGFPGECVNNGSVLVIKTHEPPELPYPYTILYKDKAILLIRHPRDAILSFYNYMFGGHYATAPFHSFCESNPIENIFSNLSAADYVSVGNQKFKTLHVWSNYVNNQIEFWKYFYGIWLNDFEGPLHFVFYEDLVQDISSTLRGIFSFLNVQVTKHALDCALRNREGIYRRQHKHQEFDPFTPRMLDNIDKVRIEVLEAVSHVMKSIPQQHNNVWEKCKKC